MRLVGRRRKNWERLKSEPKDSALLQRLNRARERKKLRPLTRRDVIRKAHASWQRLTESKRSYINQYRNEVYYKRKTLERLIAHAKAVQSFVGKPYPMYRPLVKRYKNMALRVFQEMGLSQFHIDVFLEKTGLRGAKIPSDGMLALNMRKGKEEVSKAFSFVLSSMRKRIRQLGRRKQPTSEAVPKQGK